jgi:outer membrane protein
MPEMKAAQNQLEKLTKTYQADLQTMATELQNKMKQYQAEAATKTDDVNGQRAQEVQSMRDNVMKYEQNAQQEMAKRQEGLIKPIMEKARVAIQKVARAKGYQYVIDSTAGSGLILADGPNLLNDVKKELGM